MGVLHGQAPLLKKLVMLRPCRTTFNPGATFSLCPLPQPQTPSRAAGSFNGPSQSKISEDLNVCWWRMVAIAPTPASAQRHAEIASLSCRK
jgi:hypothetical protein